MDSHLSDLGLPRKPILSVKILNIKMVMKFTVFTSGLFYTVKFFWSPGPKEKKKTNQQTRKTPKSNIWVFNGLSFQEFTFIF